jgi:2-methylcitrate dehydratase PrpD
MSTAIKPFPACHFTHGCIDAALALAAHGLDTARIKAVEALVPEGVVKTICEPESNKKKPANSYDAQFSVHYLVAAALRRQQFGLSELEPEAIADKDILALTQKVGYRIDPDSPFPAAYSGEVVITMDDGRVLRHREQINRGAADRPLTNSEIIVKYEANASMTVDRDSAERMRQTMLGLDSLPRATDVLAAFSPAATA